MRRIVIGAFVCFASVSTVWPQAEVGPSASGHGNMTILDGLQTLSFHARKFKDGSVTGSMVVKSRAQNARLFAELDCLAVIGSTTLDFNGTATMSGKITKSDNPVYPVGYKLIFRVIDNGEGSNDPPDLMTDVVVYPTGTVADCRTPMNLLPAVMMVVEEGNIQVRPGRFSLLH
jgi:hypothetical protein